MEAGMRGPALIKNVRVIPVRGDGRHDSDRVGEGEQAPAEQAPGIRLGVENLADPRFGDDRADMFFSASPEDRARVEQLIDAVGLRPVYLGDGQHDVVDGVLRLWFALVMGQRHSRHLAFKMLER